MRDIGKDNIKIEPIYGANEIPEYKPNIDKDKDGYYSTDPGAIAIPPRSYFYTPEGYLRILVHEYNHYKTYQKGVKQYNDLNDQYRNSMAEW